MTSRPVHLDLIRLDGDTQPRAEIDEAVVAEYAEAMDAGDEFPPIVVLSSGADSRLSDALRPLPDWTGRGVQLEGVEMNSSTDCNTTLTVDLEEAIASKSSVVIANAAAEMLDHLIAAVEGDRELPTVIRQHGGLRQRATELYLAVDAFYRELKRLAGDDDLHLHAEEPMVAPYSHRQRSHDAALRGLVHESEVHVGLAEEAR